MVVCLFLFYFFEFHYSLIFFLFFFFNDTATTEIYTLSLHDALPIYSCCRPRPFYLGGSHAATIIVRCPTGAQSLYGACSAPARLFDRRRRAPPPQGAPRDRKSTRLNSSHDQISYAVFCLKKKNLPHC